MPALVRSSTTLPTPEKVRENDFYATFLVPPTRWFVRAWAQRLTVEGREHVAGDQPCLILANHTSLMDPMSILLTSPRYAQFMATQSLFNGTLGRILAWWGVIPKKKFTADAKAIRLLKGWTEAGSPVALFPEGQRTWDGRPLPLLDGIEKLVRLLHTPVVTARIYNADRVWPRWAPAPRRGRVHVVFDPPRAFERRADPAEIRRVIAEAIRVEEERHRYPVRGKNLAVGLSNVLFACPSCGAVGGLAERADHIGCRGCGTAWRVDTSNRLTPDDVGPALTIAEAFDTVRAAFAERDWVADVDRFGSDGVILASEETEMFDVTDDTPVPVGRGRVVLTQESVRLVGGDAWEIPLSELRSVSAEQRDRLYFFAKDRCFEPLLPGDSVVKWELVTEHWRARAQQSPP